MGITKILPFFLVEADKQGESFVHCSGGIGRTGHVTAHGWLVVEIIKLAAIAAVRRTGRNPYEAAIAAVIRVEIRLKLLGPRRTS